MSFFPNVSPKQSFPALESEVLAYWKANNTFKKSIESRPADNPYRFYDGPPFITGTPHYGSLLSSIVKDTVGRYWTMKGKRVDRVWGWDCHGLPIEEKVQKKLGLHSNKEIEERGIKEFIDGCYEYTQTTSAEWDWYIDKIGRWVDMDRAYRTMDQDYMESVMWVFKQLWDKGLIYKGKRVSLYSWKLSTPISNFEVAMDDTYQDVNDPAITVKFELTQDQKCADEKECGQFEYTEDGYLRYVLGVTKNENGEILQLKNKKHGGKWQCPGGKIDKWETAEQALKREIKEELGVDCEIISKISENKIFTSGTIWQGEYYEVKLLGKPVIQEPHKHEKIEWAKIFINENDEKILKTETEEYSDKNFIERNYDLLHLFRGENNPGKISILAWTTTPWTIPANMALAVGKDIDYVLVKNGDEQFIVAKSRVEAVFKGKGDYEIIRTFKGEELVGMKYQPPFDYFYKNQNNDKNHTVYHAEFATDTDGTGIVHVAPEFGDVDYMLGKEIGLTITEAVDNEGKYTSQIHDYAGTHYLDANKINVERMKENETLFKNESITHRIPFCPRSGTPLMQKAQDSWFIDIQSQKEKLLAANEKINWFPEYLKYGRFAKGIESAPDWCISRTRFWWCPMPIWLSEDGKEQLVVSSREEIFEYNKPYGQLEKREVDGKTKYFFTKWEFAGQELNLHRPYIDEIKLQSPTTGAELTRIKEVLDVWMDSGSMPYAQMHYPFENKDAMEASFPADFIAEYVGQVRAWFYVMHVLGVLLGENIKNTIEPTPSFTNVITTGVINGNDGRKMSKSFGNYPDPRATIEKYGADPIRFYMLNSPLLSGGDMDFKEEGIIETIKSVMLPVWNTYSFFTTYANIDGWKPTENAEINPTNPLDKWILSRLQILIGKVHEAMEAYDVSRATRSIVEYMGELTNWYVRLSRRRFWGSEMTEDKNSAYSTLHTVLVEISKILAPYMPFMAEDMFRGLTGRESVHLEYVTLPNEKLISEELNRDMELASEFVSLGLALRSRKNIRVRQPLASITLPVKLDQYYENIIKSELNVKEIFVENPENLAKKICKPDARKIGPKFGKDVQKIIVAAKNGDFSENSDGSIQVGKFRLEDGEFVIEYLANDATADIEGGYGTVIAMDTTLTNDLICEGIARDIIRQIQDMRKEADYQVTDKISLALSGDKLSEIQNFVSMIESETLSTLVSSLDNADISKELELEDFGNITIALKK